MRSSSEGCKDHSLIVLTEPTTALIIQFISGWSPIRKLGTHWRRARALKWSSRSPQAQYDDYCWLPMLDGCDLFRNATRTSSLPQVRVLSGVIDKQVVGPSNRPTTQVELELPTRWLTPQLDSWRSRQGWPLPNVPLRVPADRQGAFGRAVHLGSHGVLPGGADGVGEGGEQIFDAGTNLGHDLRIVVGHVITF